MGIKTIILLCCALSFSCASQKNTAPIIQGPTGMAWALLELNGKSVEELGQTASEAYLILNSENDKLSGSTGCNQLLGSYQMSENKKIKFSKIAMTKRGCEGADHEMEFARAVEGSSNYQIRKDTLILLDEAGSIQLKMLAQPEKGSTTEP